LPVISDNGERIKVWNRIFWSTLYGPSNGVLFSWKDQNGRIWKSDFTGQVFLQSTVYRTCHLYDIGEGKKDIYVSHAITITILSRVKYET
jgi:hypothetical protein